MHETALHGGLVAKTASSLLTGKTSRVPGGLRCLPTLLEQMDDDDKEGQQNKINGE